MLTTTFDTHAAVKQLRAAGVGDTQAETLVDVIRRSIGDTVTRADIEPLATKEFVRAEIAGIHARIDGTYTEIGGVRTEIGGVRTEIAGVHTEIAGVHTKIAGVHTKIAGVRTEIAQLEARLFRHLWVMAIGIVGATFTLLKLFP